MCRSTTRCSATSVQELAAAIGSAASTFTVALQTRRPPSAPLQQRLTQWLAAAPEVAAEKPFRRNDHAADNGATKQIARIGDVCG
jgi:hypothetical protein